MNTPSHLVMTAALYRALGDKRIAIPPAALLLGSVVPDLPLAAISLGTLVYYRVIVGDQSTQLMSKMFDQLYFNDPFWIAGHNLIHSPTALLLYLALLWRWRAEPAGRRHWLFWFFVGCLLHSVVDILTHYDDGPLLFFPFDWRLRFPSPVSYWDREHFGREFALLEIAFNLLLLGYLFLPGLIRRFAGCKKRAAD